jgi:hypothetical protein
MEYLEVLRSFLFPGPYRMISGQDFNIQGSIPYAGSSVLTKIPLLFR